MKDHLSNPTSLLNRKMASFSSAHLLFYFILSLYCILCSALHHDFSIMGYTPDDLKSGDSLIDLFEAWISKHKRSYASIEEKLHRFEVFKDNLLHIDEANRRESNYWLGLNEFADLSHDEFKSSYLGLKLNLSRRKSEKSNCHGNFRYKDAKNLPKAVDWRKKGAVTNVKNQGQCGKLD